MSGNKLTFDKIRAHLERVPDELADKEASVGYFEGVAYEDGTPVAYVATIQEFGSPIRNIPARATLGPTLSDNKDDYLKLMNSGVKAVLDGQVTGSEMLELIGAQVAGDVRKAIGALTDPPLSPATIAAKHSDKPLIESGLMQNSVANAVTNK